MKYYKGFRGNCQYEAIAFQAEFDRMQATSKQRKRQMKFNFSDFCKIFLIFQNFHEPFLKFLLYSMCRYKEFNSWFNNWNCASNFLSIHWPFCLYYVCCDNFPSYSYRYECLSLLDHIGHYANSWLPLLNTIV